MIKLIKNGKVYTPDYLGEKDILIAGNSIIMIEEGIDPDQLMMDVEVIDVEGKIVTPGFLDQHVHIIGGGGEDGFHSRTPEVNLSTIIESGITTVVGLLGTDGSTRNIESLLAKANSLENEGITTYIHTGSYELPSVTLTDKVRKDIVFIDKVLGVKIALSDHRSSQPTVEELTRLASDVRVAGMLSGKTGIVHIHMGYSKEKMDKIMEIVGNTDIPITHFRPTHVSKNRELLEQAMEFAKMGGRIDLTAYEDLETGSKKILPHKAIVECIKNDIPIENITLSSDGNGSMPKFDEKGEVVGVGIGTMKSLHNTVIKMVEEGMGLSTALKFITSNVAANLGIYPAKGCLSSGSDADIVVMDEELNIDMVFAKGKKMMDDGQVIVKGTFE